MAEDLPSEDRLVELIQHRLVEPLADAVRLRVARLGPGVFDLVKLKVELVGMLVKPATVFGPTIGQDAKDIHTLLSDTLELAHYAEEQRKAQGRLLAINFDHDTQGNTLFNDAVALKTTNSLLYAERGLISTYGLDQILVIRKANQVYVLAGLTAEQIQQKFSELGLPTEGFQQNNAFIPLGWIGNLEFGSVLAMSNRLKIALLVVIFSFEAKSLPKLPI